MPQVAICLDFCDTLYDGKVIQTMDDFLLTADQMAQADWHRETMLPKLEAGTITEEETTAWYDLTFRLWTQAELTMCQLEQCFHAIRLRDGVLDLLSWARQVDIPVSIISASCKDIIEVILRQKGLRHLIDEVYAPELTWQNGRVTGVVPASRVNVHTKGLFAQSFARKHGVCETMLIGIGDSHNDRLLAAGKGTLFGLAADQAHAAKIKPPFHEVVIDNNLFPLLERVQRHVGR